METVCGHRNFGPLETLEGFPLSPWDYQLVTRANSTNVLDEGLRTGETGRRMNSKVKSVKQGVCRK
jgi:hypothetical protein